MQRTLRRFIVPHLRIRVQASGRKNKKSDNNADQPSITVIDDLLHRILELHLTLLVDHIDLIAHPIQHQLFYRFSKYVGSPYSLRSLTLCFDIFHQILCLLFTSHDRCDLSLILARII